MKRNIATKMTAKKQRRMSRILRLRGVDISFADYENDKERVAESSYSNLRRGAEASEGKRPMRRVKMTMMANRMGSLRRARGCGPHALRRMHKSMAEGEARSARC